MAMRGRKADYAVSLIKAGVRLQGFDADLVRTPLEDPSAAETAALKALIDRIGGA